MKDPQFVPSVLNTKATAALSQEVNEDLQRPDPTPEKALAVLENQDEDTDTNKQAGSS